MRQMQMLRTVQLITKTLALYKSFTYLLTYKTIKKPKTTRNPAVAKIANHTGCQ